jgi:nucleoside-diphosphate-sugar epimerase
MATVVILGGARYLTAATLTAALQEAGHNVCVVDEPPAPQIPITHVIKYEDMRNPQLDPEPFIKPPSFSGNPRHSHHTRPHRNHRKR